MHPTPASIVKRAQRDEHAHLDVLAEMFEPLLSFRFLSRIEFTLPV